MKLAEARIWNAARRRFFLGALLPLALGGCAQLNTLGTSKAPSATQASAVDAEAGDAWKQIADAMGKPGILRDGVYTVTFPRDDLSVSIDGMDVPTAAGLESSFRFYRCPCGKTVVIGQLLTTDYETNDVVYALQKENILVSTMGPFLIYEKPRLRQVRFQAEGEPGPLARAIRSALDWMGPNRAAPQKIQ